MYLASVDYAYWKDGSAVRFAYGCNGGSWWGTGIGGTWQAIGASGLTASFLGDGAYHDLNNGGWSYMYISSIDCGYWKNGNGPRLAYGYNGGQWWDTGIVGGTWQTLASGLTPDFLGDGAYHDLNNGWSYMYLASVDYAYWKNGSTERFAYGCTAGQWWDYGMTGWSTLGPAGLSASFLGDGSSHTLDSLWSYSFSGGIGYWNNTSLNLSQFKYDYGTGQWQDEGKIGGWSTLGPAGLSASFLGDGSSHTLDSLWSYTFSSGISYWTNTALNLSLFKYDYGTGAWYDQGKYGGWVSLGAAGSSFVGDGSSLTLYGKWSYNFSGGVGFWTNTSLNLAQFKYDYGTGQWYDEGKTGGWATLGPVGLSASFLGDGNPRTLDSNWQYKYDYDYQGGAGAWTSPSVWVIYNYSLGHWWGYDNFDGSTEFDFSGGFSAAFIGDGAWHDIGGAYNGTHFKYQYDLAGGNYGYWYNNDLGFLQYKYSYDSGQWYDEGKMGGWATLGPAGLSSRFMGDGNTRTLDSNWSYRFSDGIGSWTNASLKLSQFNYDYSAGQWSHAGRTWGFADVGPIAMSASFLGDGNWHSISSNLWYMYNYSTSLGYEEDSSQKPWVAFTY